MGLGECAIFGERTVRPSPDATVPREGVKMVKLWYLRCDDRCWLYFGHVGGRIYRATLTNLFRLAEESVQAAPTDTSSRNGGVE